MGFVISRYMNKSEFSNITIQNQFTSLIELRNVDIIMYCSFSSCYEPLMFRSLGILKQQKFGLCKERSNTIIKPWFIA